MCEPAPQLVREGCGELGRYLEGLAPRPDAPSVEHGTAKLQKALVKVFVCNTDKFELYHFAISCAACHGTEFLS